MVDGLIVITDADPSLDDSEEEDHDDSVADHQADRLRGIASELGAGEGLAVGGATYTLGADLQAGPTK